MTDTIEVRPRLSNIEESKPIRRPSVLNDPPLRTYDSSTSYSGGQEPTPAPGPAAPPQKTSASTILLLIVILIMAFAAMYWFGFCVPKSIISDVSGPDEIPDSVKKAWRSFIET